MSLLVEMLEAEVLQLPPADRAHLVRRVKWAKPNYSIRKHGGKWQDNLFANVKYQGK